MYLHIPPHISQTANMFLLLFGMPVGHLNGWLAFIQKCPRDLLSSFTIMVYGQYNFLIISVRGPSLDVRRG